MSSRHLALAAALLAGASAAALDDIAGSRDPTGVPRFPRAAIIEFSHRDDSLPYEFVTAPVEKTRRDVRIKGAVRVQGPLTRVTYQMADGTRPQEVIDHYLALATELGVEPVFSCHGRACGRSAAWANEVFGVAILASSNDSQHYTSLPLKYAERQQLVAVYVVQRGSRRVYAHVDVVEPTDDVQFDENRNIVARLTRNGHAVIRGVEPDRNGALTTEDVAVLQDVGGSLGAIGAQELYVVCHLYGPQPVAKLIELSNGCAEKAADALAAVGSVRPVPFGSGPLLAREAHSRIELVLPRRLRRD